MFLFILDVLTSFNVRFHWCVTWLIRLTCLFVKQWSILNRFSHRYILLLWFYYDFSLNFTVIYYYDFTCDELMESIKVQNFRCMISNHDLISSYTHFWSNYCLKTIMILPWLAGFVLFLHTLTLFYTIFRSLEY